MKKILGVIAVALFLVQCSNSPKEDKLALAGDTSKVAVHKPLMVCNLTEEEQFKREEELKNTVFKRVKKTIELEDGYEFVFIESVDYSLQLVEFINFERKCCPGFTYTLTFEPEEGAIKLKIGNSKEIKEMLKTVLDEMQG